MLRFFPANKSWGDLFSPYSSFLETTCIVKPYTEIPQSSLYRPFSRSRRFFHVDFNRETGAVWMCVHLLHETHSLCIRDNSISSPPLLLVSSTPYSACVFLALSAVIKRWSRINCNGEREREKEGLDLREVSRDSKYVQRWCVYVV